MRNPWVVRRAACYRCPDSSGGGQTGPPWQREDVRPSTRDRDTLRRGLARASAERRRWYRRMAQRPTTSAQGDLLISLGCDPEDVPLDRGAAAVLLDELMARRQAEREAS